MKSFEHTRLRLLSQAAFDVHSQSKIDEERAKRKFDEALANYLEARVATQLAKKDLNDKMKEFDTFFMKSDKPQHED